MKETKKQQCEINNGILDTYTYNSPHDGQKIYAERNNEFSCVL